MKHSLNTKTNPGYMQTITVKSKTFFKKGKEMRVHMYYSPTSLFFSEIF